MRISRTGFVCDFHLFRYVIICPPKGTNGGLTRFFGNQSTRTHKTGYSLGIHLTMLLFQHFLNTSGTVLPPLLSESSRVPKGWNQVLFNETGLLFFHSVIGYFCSPCFTQYRYRSPPLFMMGIRTTGVCSGYSLYRSTLSKCT